MKFPRFKTKIVCTLGPASHDKKTIKQLVIAGMSVARLNLAHDLVDYHRETLRYIHKVEKELRIFIPVMMDLPGPKIRIGEIQDGPILLRKGESIRLTTKKMMGNRSMISVEYKDLINSVKPGNLIYLYDGYIQLKVKEIHQDKEEVVCQIITGGKLDSHKGLNLPKAKILLDPISERDLELIEFGLSEGVTIFGLSFIERAADIIKVKEFAHRKGKEIFAVAKIEREEALKNIEEILQVTDAIMIARGDLGVQVAIEEIPVIQKKLISLANRASRPVITATQMLVSMTEHIRPTRSEVTDVANAIFDGSDATMLSEETAVGQFPVEATRMMADIAVSTERQYQDSFYHSLMCENFRYSFQKRKPSVEDMISLHTVESSRIMNSKYILTPTESGNTARRISRFKPHCWILAFTPNSDIARFLMFSYGVISFPIAKQRTDWYKIILDELKKKKLIKKGELLILTEGTIRKKIGGTDSLRIISVD
ncbi:MAG: pyruvate kinase [Candidatus Atribacteria bacterium]|nr:pyruvate kinase [Candidatus Atribacteria bacterium]